ncbi:MAG: beta-lactamase family protein, partial [Gammaproteobacteria bacterium]|nr:beta-lactamase family protein [Gammaproteobacteria bacterium]
MKYLLTRLLLIGFINFILLGDTLSHLTYEPRSQSVNDIYYSKTANNTEISTHSSYLPQSSLDIYLPQTSGIRADLLKNIAPLIEKSIAAHYYPGAVILIGHHGKIIYSGVFGNRRILPNIAPMHVNTLFDLASLTKVIATTPAIMQLIEQGKLILDAPVATYWPAFGKNGKDKITIRELLTHVSGLPADIPVTHSSKTEVYKQIEQLSLLLPIHKKSMPNKPDPSPANRKPLSYKVFHGSSATNKKLLPNKIITVEKKFLYSDINFIVLAHLVEIVSGESFENYCKHHIFEPLGMNHTYFLPDKSLRDNIAPTESSPSRLLWGIPQDPLAQAMGGVSGNAGLFSNVHDISLYLQCLLNGGRIGKTNHYLLGPLSILKMTTPQTPPNDANVRGLGWDIDSPYSNRGILFPVTSYGHTGWTGTSIWVDPTTQ